VIVTALADQNPGLRDARLPVVHQARHLQMLDGVVDVGVVEDDRRGLSSEFQAHRHSSRRHRPSGPLKLLLL
jgi:hypothetical protein